MLSTSLLHSNHPLKSIEITSSTNKNVIFPKEELKNGVIYPGFTDDEIKMMKANQNIHDNEDRLKMSIEQRKEAIKLMWEFLHDRFGTDFNNTILTKDSNFYDNSYLLKCHKFVQAMSLKNFNYEKSIIVLDPYNQIKSRLYLNDYDYVEFLQIGYQYLTLRFSFDVAGNIFNLKYPYPCEVRKDNNIDEVKLQRQISLEKEQILKQQQSCTMK